MNFDKQIRNFLLFEDLVSLNLLTVGHDEFICRKMFNHCISDKLKENEILSQFAPVNKKYSTI